MSAVPPPALVQRAIELLTGNKVTRSAAEDISRRCGSREELLAHLLVDQRVLERLPLAKAAFEARVARVRFRNASAGSAIAEEEQGSVLGPDEAVRLLARFSEEPTAVAVLDALHRSVQLRRSR